MIRPRPLLLERPSVDNLHRHYVVPYRAHTKGGALVRLWSEAARHLDVRYPDQATHVEFTVGQSYYDEGASIRINYRNLRDSGKPDQRMTYPFGYTVTVSTWPGYKAAETFLVSMHSLLMWHESMEQVTKPGVVAPWDVEGARPICPHYGYAEQENTKLFDRVTTGNIRDSIAFIIGNKEADEMIAKGYSRATKELANEMAAGDWTE